MAKVTASLVFALSMIATSNLASAEQLIPQGDWFHCNEEKGAYYQHYGYNPPVYEGTYYINRPNLKRDRYAAKHPGINVIRLCPSFWKKVFAPSVSEVQYDDGSAQALTEEEYEAVEEETADEHFVDQFDYDRHGVPEPKVVQYPNAANPGDIIIETDKYRLYYILNSKKAKEYRIAVGKDGYSWSGRQRVTALRPYPEWRPPQAMIEREAKKNHFLPDVVSGGDPENPLGPRAIYLGDTQYRIHGTIHPETIGQSASSGCFRMLNADVVELYENMTVGSDVYVYGNENVAESIY